MTPRSAIHRADASVARRRRLSALGGAGSILGALALGCGLAWPMESDAARALELAGAAGFGLGWLLLLAGLERREARRSEDSEALRALLAAIDTTDASVAVFDDKGTLLTANACFRELQEATLAATGQALRLHELLGTDAALPDEGEVRDVRPGDGRWWRIARHRLPSGALASVAIEIGRTKARETELRLLHESIEASPFPFCLFDAGERPVLWNPSYRALYARAFERLGAAAGWTYPDLLAANLPDGIGETERDAAIAGPLALHRQATGVPTDRQVGQRWHRVSKVRLPSGAVAGFGVDVTAIKEREAELERSEALFRALAETVPVAIWSIDRNGTTAFANATLRAMLDADPLRDTTLRFASIVAGAPDLASLAGRRFEGDLAASGQPPRRVLVVTSPWIADRSGAETCLAALIDISELTDAQRTIELLALHDPLTGLKNRTGFGRMLEANVPVAGPANPVALLALDLDRFKEVNDRHGHAAGDHVLREVADRIRVVAGPEPGLCRLGGDEFAILLRADQARALEVAQRLLAEIGRPIELDEGAGEAGEVGASIGIALAPDHATDIETLLRYADLALYRAKALGRNRAVLFHPGLDEEAKSRRRMEAEILAALEDSEFRLVFQPQFDAGSGVLTGLECLLRWHNPRVGRDIPPGVFIPVAEQTGLIAGIDAWVLQAALRQAAAWTALGLVLPGISVNVSPASLRSTGFADRVIRGLEEHGVAPGTLELEVTEGVALTERAQAGEVLHRLRGYGVGIALDDFGAGYASLGQVKALPLTRLKIDRSLVDRVSVSERDAAIMQAIAALGAALGLPTLAEGVETEEQLAAIRRLGCTEVQGFLWGVPLEAGPFASTWLQARPALPTAPRVAEPAVTGPAEPHPLRATLPPIGRSDAA